MPFVSRSAGKRAEFNSTREEEEEGFRCNETDREKRAPRRGRRGTEVGGATNVGRGEENWMNDKGQLIADNYLSV